jgi:hypothetical protein
MDFLDYYFILFLESNFFLKEDEEFFLNIKESSILRNENLQN